MSIIGGYSGRRSKAGVPGPSLSTTFNPDDKHADIALSDGNYTATSTLNYKGVRTIAGHTTGKYCYAGIVTSPLGTYAQRGFGWCTDDYPLTNQIAYSNESWGVCPAYNTYVYIFGSFAQISDSWVSGVTVLMSAVDIDTGKVWFGVDGSWDGDPGAGTDEAGTMTVGGKAVHGHFVPERTDAYGTIQSTYPYEVPEGFSIL